MVITNCPFFSILGGIFLIFPLDLQETTTPPPANWISVTFIFSSHYIWNNLWTKHFGYLTLTLDITFWIFTLNLTMAEEINKQLATLWEKGGIEFSHFEFVTQQQCDKKIHDTPKKYEEKITASTFLREQHSSDICFINCRIHQKLHKAGGRSKLLGKDSALQVRIKRQKQFMT